MKTLKEKISELPEERQQAVKTRAAELIQEWNDYVESMGSVMGEVEHLTNRMSMELERLIEKCDKQAKVLQHIIPEKFPGVYFIVGESGEKDRNGLPESIQLSPTYGADFTVLYKRVK